MTSPPPPFAVDRVVFTVDFSDVDRRKKCGLYTVLEEMQREDISLNRVDDAQVSRYLQYRYRESNHTAFAKYYYTGLNREELANANTRSDSW